MTKVHLWRGICIIGLRRSSVGSTTRRLSTGTTEYVATDRITRQYREILKAIADAQAEPQESIGV